MNVNRELNTKGFILLLVLAGVSTWQVFPIGPTWGLATFLLWWVAVGVFPLLATWILGGLDERGEIIEAAMFSGESRESEVAE